MCSSCHRRRLMPITACSIGKGHRHGLREPRGADVRLMEVDVAPPACDRRHLEGGCGINRTTQLGAPVGRDIPTQQSWSRLMGECGVTNQTRLVFYGDNNNWFAAFAYWVASIY